MITIRVPFRVSFFGGGSDYKQWVAEHGGCCLNTSIDKYCYLTVRKLPPFFEHKYRIVWSRIENVRNISEINHDSARECLRFMDSEEGLEILHIGDLPAGAGLGASSAYTVGLLHALHTLQDKPISKLDLALEAIHVEQDLIKSNVGCQDQLSCAIGGLNFMEFGEGRPLITRVQITPERLNELQSCLMLVFTGFPHMASDIAATYNFNKDYEITEMMKMAHEALKILKEGDIVDFGKLLHESWQLKKSLSPQISNPYIDYVYQTAREAGAIGGKICFIPNTLIETPSGLRVISDIKKDDYVYDHTKTPRIVLDTIQRQYIGDVLEIKITGVENTITSTPDHPFMLTRKATTGKRINQKLPNLLFMKRASDMKVGDCLLIPIKNEVQDIGKFVIERNVVQSKYSNVDIYKRIPISVPINKDFLFVVGLYIAEGSNSNKQIQVSLHKREQLVAERFADIILKLFNVKCQIAPNGIGTNGIKVQGTSKVLAHLLGDLCGEGAANKHIPSDFMKLPIEKQVVLLSAIWNGDGYTRFSYDKRTNKTYINCLYKTVSRMLAYQIRELCARAGYVASISREEPTFQYFKKYSSIHSPTYTVEICGDDAIAFNSVLGQERQVLFERRNNKKLSLQKDIVEIEGVRYIKRSIRKITTKKYNGVVNNLDVADTHTFLTSGVAVHNCGAGGGGFMLLFVEPDKQKYIKEKLGGLLYVPFQFESEGTSVVFQNSEVA